MKSIRRRITLALLGGLAMLGLAGGSAVYLASRAAMLARIDAGNEQLCRQVRALVRGPGGGAGRGRTVEPDDSARLVADGIYYQVWSAAGETLLRSESLGTLSLPGPSGGESGTAPDQVRLLPGLELRLATTRFGGGPGGGGPPWAGGGRQPVTVTVGRDLAPYRAELRQLLGAMGIIGLAAAAASTVIIALALRSGLRPLRQLDASLARVDASTLGVRFHHDALPQELAPVARRLDELMARLEQSFRREREFGSALAHELRTPIAELQALAELAIEWPEERGEDQMRSIHEVARRMERMVETLLELARVETGTADGFGEIDLAPLLDDLHREHRAAADSRQLTLRLDWPSGEPRPGRADWWHHLLGNLVANAVEYAREGGRVELSAIADGLQLANSVGDLNPGDLPHLFDRFWRADRARSGEVHSGLGLALARACAEAMGYRIDARLESASGDDRLLVMRVRRAPPAQ